MDLSKEEILGNIQRLSARRREKRALVKQAREDLIDRSHELPAYQELQKASDDAKLVAAKLNEQRDADETWNNFNRELEAAKQAAELVEESLSEMLILYMVVTKKRSVHADPDEPTSVNHEIKTVARLGKKITENLSLFDQEDGGGDE